MSARFDQFVAIDWSGAVGARHLGIALAVCAAGRGAPVLVRPGHIWSRLEVFDWLLHDLPQDSLVGLDLGISFPFADFRAFFPGSSASPDDARSLWALVDATCHDEPDLAASRFVDHPQFSPYFRRHGGRTGDRFTPGRGRLRITEQRQRAMGLNPYSNFNLVGAAQVGKSSLTGMRLLHRIGDALPVWPIDPLPERGSVIVEIYTSLAAFAAGRRPGRAKMRDIAALNDALAVLGSDPVCGTGAISDHASDALLTAAWLRAVYAETGLWHPPGLDAVRHTEGWTFGVR